MAAGLPVGSCHPRMGTTALSPLVMGGQDLSSGRSQGAAAGSIVGVATGNARKGIAVPRKRWSELSKRTRILVVTLAAFEGALKIYALVDLKRRPAAQIRGSKGKWVLAVLTVNSAGAVPIAYLVYGRHQPSAHQAGR